MPTVISHVAVPLALGLGAGSSALTWRLVAVGVAASVLPDLDVIAFKFGIAYSDQLGHRGFSHSLAFAALLGSLAALVAPWLQSKRWVAFFFVFLCAASHGLLDMLTNGGLGIAYFWPWSEQRFFFDSRPIQVSPFGVRHLFGPSGLALLKSELTWIWAPALTASLVLRLVFHLHGRLTGRPANAT